MNRTGKEPTFQSCFKIYGLARDGFTSKVLGTCVSNEYGQHTKKLSVLGQVQTLYFTLAESNAKEGEQRILLICIRFGSCEVRCLNLALAINQDVGSQFRVNKADWFVTCVTGTLRGFEKQSPLVISVASHKEKIYLYLTTELQTSTASYRHSPTHFCVVIL